MTEAADPRLSWSLTDEERRALDYTMTAIRSMRVEGESFDERMKRELAFIGAVRSPNPPGKPERSQPLPS